MEIAAHRPYCGDVTVRPLVTFAALVGLALLPPQASAETPASSPQLGRSFVVSQVSGTVLVKPSGSARSSRLTGRRTIPVGSTVDATRGKVRLVGAVNRSGGTQAGVFYAGAFKATQARRTRAVVDLRLVGGSFAGCGTGAASAAAARRRVRGLWGIAKGRFRTRGRHSAATIRGTKWLTEDKCHSTLVASERGTVTVSKEETTCVAICAGFTVSEGSVYETQCSKAPLPIPGYAGHCTHLHYGLPGGGRRRGFKGPTGFVAFYLFIDFREAERSRSADVCVRRAGGVEERCTTYSLSGFCDFPGPPLCDYVTGDSCRPESGAGDYVFRWRVDGLDLPFAQTARAPRPDSYWLDTDPRQCTNESQMHTVPPIP